MTMQERLHLEDIRKRYIPAGYDWDDSPTAKTLNTVMEGLRSQTRSRGMSVGNRKSARRSAAMFKARSLITTRDWTLEDILSRGGKTKLVDRVSSADPRLEAEIRAHKRGGIPLIIEGVHHHRRWNAELMTLEKFQALSDETINARNVHNWEDKEISLRMLVDNLRNMSPYASVSESERLYGKDAPCPVEWAGHMSDILPPMLLEGGPENLLQNLESNASVQTLMCYLGVGDTFTCMHKDLCGSSGQNLMCYTEKGGSSFWFMTKSSDAPAVSRYFHKIRQELDHESYTIPLEKMLNAPFLIYIAEQKLGDMVLIPPRSAHQVINHGGITIKTSWSRMTVEGLSAALYYELPIYRRVCRAETYKVMFTIWLSLTRHTAELDSMVPYSPEDGGEFFTSDRVRLPVSSLRDEPSPVQMVQRMQKTNTLWKLLLLFDDILVQEYSPEHAQMQHLEDKSSNITCDFCACDVFQSFLECRECVNESDQQHVAPGHGFVICPSCYVDGRTCMCGSMIPVQFRRFEELVLDRKRAAHVLRRLGQARRDLTLLDDAHLESLFVADDRFGIFEAACILRRERARLESQPRPALRSTRTCTSRGRSISHEVPPASRLQCKKCHSGKCFEDILVDHGIHSVEAVLLHNKDLKHEHWHRRHATNKLLNDEMKRECVDQEILGHRPDLLFAQAITAHRYSICMPWKQNSVSGWYDKKFLMVLDSTPSEDQVSADLLEVNEEASDTDSMPALSSDLSRAKASSGHTRNPHHTPPAEPTHNMAQRASSLTSSFNPDASRSLSHSSLLSRYVQVPQAPPRRLLPSCYVQVPQVPYVEALKKKAVVLSSQITPSSQESLIGTAPRSEYSSDEVTHERRRLSASDKPAKLRQGRLSSGDSHTKRSARAKRKEAPPTDDPPPKKKPRPEPLPTEANPRVDQPRERRGSFNTTSTNSSIPRITTQRGTSPYHHQMGTDGLAAALNASFEDGFSRRVTLSSMRIPKRRPTVTNTASAMSGSVIQEKVDATSLQNMCATNPTSVLLHSIQEQLSQFVAEFRALRNDVAETRTVDQHVRSRLSRMEHLVHRYGDSQIQDSPHLVLNSGAGANFKVFLNANMNENAPKEACPDEGPVSPTPTHGWNLRFLETPDAVQSRADIGQSSRPPRAKYGVRMPEDSRGWAEDNRGWAEDTSAPRRVRDGPIPTGPRKSFTHHRAPGDYTLGWSRYRQPGPKRKLASNANVSGHSGYFPRDLDHHVNAGRGYRKPRSHIADPRIFTRPVQDGTAGILADKPARCESMGASSSQTRLLDRISPRDEPSATDSFIEEAPLQLVSPPLSQVDSQSSREFQDSPEDWEDTYAIDEEMIAPHPRENVVATPAFVNSQGGTSRTVHPAEYPMDS